MNVWDVELHRGELGYFAYRDNLAGDIRRGIVPLNVDAIFARTVACAGVDTALAGEWADRFCGNLLHHVEQRRKMATR